MAYSPNVSQCIFRMIHQENFLERWEISNLVTVFFTVISSVGPKSSNKNFMKGWRRSGTKDGNWSTGKFLQNWWGVFDSTNRKRSCFGNSIVLENNFVSWWEAFDSADQKRSCFGNNIALENNFISSPLHVRSSGCSVKPAPHSQTKLPTVLLHTSWQLPLSTSHSSISVGNNNK